MLEKCISLCELFDLLLIQEKFSNKKTTHLLLYMERYNVKGNNIHNI